MVAHKYAVGTKLEAKWQTRWYKASVVKQNTDGSYEIKWPGVQNTAGTGQLATDESTYPDRWLRDIKVKTAKAAKPATQAKRHAPAKKVAAKTIPKPKPKASRGRGRPSAARASSVCTSSPKRAASKRSTTTKTKAPVRKASSSGGGLTRRVSQEVKDMRSGIKDLVQTEKKLEVVLLCDGSGSMGSNNFNKVREVVIKVIDAFASKNPVIGVVQFGTLSKIECDVTDDYDAVKAAAKNMTYMCAGGTHTLAAFQEARKLFQPGTRGKPILFFFTDGGSVDQAVIKLSQEMQEKNITVVPVGVGVDMGLLKNIGSPGQAYHLNNFKELVQVFEENY